MQEIRFDVYTVIQEVNKGANTISENVWNDCHQSRLKENLGNSIFSYDDHWDPDSPTNTALSF